MYKKGLSFQLVFLICIAGKVARCLEGDVLSDFHADFKSNNIEQSKADRK